MVTKRVTKNVKDRINGRGVTGDDVQGISISNVYVQLVQPMMAMIRHRSQSIVLENLYLKKSNFSNITRIQ